MIIATERLWITHAQMSDLDEMFSYVSDPDVMMYERENYPTKESFEPTLRAMTEQHLLYAVRLKENNQFIGHVFLGIKHPVVNNEYNLGYIFNPLYQRKGYCSEACRALLNYAFKILHVNRVSASCNPENIASWRVMEKIGMKKEGFFKKRFFWKNDDQGHPIYTDQVFYGLHHEDYDLSSELDIKDI